MESSKSETAFERENAKQKSWQRYRTIMQPKIHHWFLQSVSTKNNQLLPNNFQLYIYFFSILGFFNLGVLLMTFILPIVFLQLFGKTISSTHHENFILGIYFTVMYIPSIIFPTIFFLRHPYVPRDTFHALFH